MTLPAASSVTSRVQVCDFVERVFWIWVGGSFLSVVLVSRPTIDRDNSNWRKKLVISTQGAKERQHCNANATLNPDTGTIGRENQDRISKAHGLTRHLRNLQSRSTTSSACSNPRERPAVCGNSSSSRIFSPSCHLLFPLETRVRLLALEMIPGGQVGKGKSFSSNEKCVAGFESTLHVMVMG
jgi:hypothetical protein